MTDTVHDAGVDQGSRRRGKRGAIAGIGIALACAAACALPFLVAGGAITGIAAFAAGWEWLALVVLVSVGVAWWAARRRRTSRAGGTGCQGSCSVDGEGCGCRHS